MNPIINLYSMKFINFLFAIIFMLGFLACGNDNDGQTQTPPDNPTEATPAAATEQSLTPLNTSSDVAMNPAHGQPGHRCDLPVGAPLDGSLTPPGKTNPLLQQPSAPAKSPVEINQTQTTAEGMNPPHGQPNHRCDIPVGAPLNSVPEQ